EPGQRTAAGPAQGGEVRRRWVGGGDDYEAARDAIENIQQSLASALDDVKSDASSKELDIQRVSQEVSTWTQMASTMMKKFADTVMSVVRNIG
ncbi:hypothetical protein L6R52_16055, partial [Myxococcota bacterium]|nr:hypothetical protein [Myxococcota bacterium]